MMELLMFGREKIGKLLVKRGYIDNTQLDEALEMQKKNGMKVGFNLVNLGYVDEETLADALSEHYNLPALNSAVLSTLRIDEKTFNLIPKEMIENNDVIPISRLKNTLTVAMADPTNQTLIGDIENICRLNVKVFVAPQSIIRKLSKKQHIRKSVLGMLEDHKDAEMISRFFAEIPDFKLDKIIGCGGFGEVYKCYQISLDRYVAIKALSKSHALNKEAIERFRLEGRIIAKLNHPNIVKIMEFGEVDDYYYFVMEFLEGQTLNTFMPGQDLITKLYIFIQLCDALGFAHKNGVIHRDIKPLNIIIDKNKNAKLLDFGIALVVRSGDTRITNPDLILGTPRYMSPEQKEDFFSIDHRSDIFSLGAIMYEAFTEQQFNPDKIIHPYELNKDIPVGLNNTILKCLRENKNDRFTSCDELRFVLSTIKDKIILSKDIIESSKKEDASVSFRDSFIIKNNYEFITQLNKTNESETFVAEHKGLGKLVVIKRYPTKKGLTENKILSHLNSPYFANILGIGEDEKRFMVIREYLDGGSLREKIKEEKPPFEKILPAIRIAAEAIDLAARNKIIHGNLHPNNILFNSKHEVKLTDFGVDSVAPPALKRYTSFKFNNNMLDEFFSFGVLIFELVTSSPFLIDKGINGNFKVVKTLNISPPIAKILTKLWGVYSPGEQVLKYSSFAEFITELKNLEQKICR